MKIPFQWLPASWGLKGKTRAIAQAEYELKGYDLELKLAEIEHGEDSAAFARAKLDLELKHDRIDQYAYDVAMAGLSSDENKAELAKLEAEFKHGRLTAQEYERKKADLTGEPWIAMPKISWDPISPSKTYFEIDYNEHFIKYLRANGYSYPSDDDCINRWLNDVCLSVTEDMAQADPEFVTPVRKIRLPDGKTEHS